MSTYRSETGEDLMKLTQAIFWIIETSFGIKSLEDVQNADDTKLRELIFCFPQIFDELKDPAIISSILA